MRIQKVGVVGAGTMGSAIAELVAFNEIDVVLTDRTPELVARGVTRVGAIVDELVAYHAGRLDAERKRLRGLGLELTADQESTLAHRLAPAVTRERGDAIKARVRAADGWDAFADVDLAIEAVFEREEVKRPVLESLDRVLPAGATIASNTSSLAISRLAHGLVHAPSTLALHFFNPPATLPLIEVAGGLETREDVVTGAIEALQGWHNHRGPLVPVRVRESPAFVVNRLLLPLLDDACHLLDEGVASARDIDVAMKAGAGLPMGPFELADLIGLDVALDVAETLSRELGEAKYRPSPRLRRMVDAGWLGRKSGRGFYEYV